MTITRYSMLSKSLLNGVMVMVSGHPMHLAIIGTATLQPPGFEFFFLESVVMGMYLAILVVH